jgi:hypothetical protein
MVPELSKGSARVGVTAGAEDDRARSAQSRQWVYKGRWRFVYSLAQVRDKNLHQWVPAYLKDRLGRALAPRYQGPRHLLFALCDHFEPLWLQPGLAVGEARVRTWWEGYPKLAARYRDSTGRPPRHSFFFPGEEYVPGYLERLADLVRGGYGEVELHLHHDNDTAENLRRTIRHYLETFASHGHLCRDGGRLRYAFIHGNWCLANGRRDGRMCGVDAELPLLFETGCYADFTFPSVPDESQPGIVNQIYWPTGDLARRRAYDTGARARVGEVMDDRVLMIQGPLAISRIASRKLGVGLEYGAGTAHDLPLASRVRRWVEQDIHVQGQPAWTFVKVYTHGAQEAQAAALLGAGGQLLHDALAALADGRKYSLHYVTAREMYNVAVAAMRGKTGNPADYYDFVLGPPPAAGRLASSQVA